MGEKSFSQVQILFWSGTGNSYRVAEWIKADAQQYGVKASIGSLDSGLPAAKVDASVLLVVTTPTHGFTAPWHVIKKVWKLPSGNGCHALCIATRAGLKFGSFYLPGISGSATFLLAFLLLLKGYGVKGVASVDMPSNWFSLHPIQRRESQERIIERGRIKTFRIMEDILSGNSVWLSPNSLYEFFWTILLSPISLLYLFWGRFFLAKIFFANNRCDGCGLCSKECSMGAIRMYGKRVPRPYWTIHCESCMRCAALCPQQAVEAGHSWGLLLYFAMTIPLSFNIVRQFGDKVLSLPGEGMVAMLLTGMYYFSAVLLLYSLFYLLLRVRWINTFFSCTTLTHFSWWGRYREPGTELRKLK